MMKIKISIHSPIVHPVFLRSPCSPGNDHSSSSSEASVFGLRLRIPEQNQFCFKKKLFLTVCNFSFNL